MDNGQDIDQESGDDQIEIFAKEYRPEMGRTWVR